MKHLVHKKMNPQLKEGGEAEVLTLQLHPPGEAVVECTAAVPEEPVSFYFTIAYPCFKYLKKNCFVGSDSEDTPVDYLSTSSSTMGNNSGCVGLTSYQPKSTRYNFCTELGNN